MTSSKMLQHMAHIIYFEEPSKNVADRLNKFKSEDWNAFVQCGSAQLILPALYCRLKQRQLLEVLPKELEQYLEELSAINRNRNRTLLQQVQDISTILQQHQINHVFLKGIALVILGCYEDKAERMIGDIDILVDPDQLGLASQLLRDEGYVYKTESFGSKYLPYHQDIRLLPKSNGIAAVELHRYPLYCGYEHLLVATDILKHKEKHNGIFTPSADHLISHVILNHEINDHGYLNANFHLRSAYDYLCLKKLETSVSFIQSHQNQNYYQFFCHKMAYYFSSFTYPKTLKPPSNLKIYAFKLQQSQGGIGKTMFRACVKSIYFYKDIIVGLFWTRFKLFCFNSNYRKDLWKDRRRVIRLIYTKFN